MSHWSLTRHLLNHKPSLLAQSITSFFPSCTHTSSQTSSPASDLKTYNLKVCFKCHDFGMSLLVWLDVSLSMFLGRYFCIELCSNSSSWMHVFLSVQQAPLTQSRVPYPVTHNPERLPLPASPPHRHEARTPCVHLHALTLNLVLLSPLVLTLMSPLEDRAICFFRSYMTTSHWPC